MYGLDLVFFLLNTLVRDNVAEKSHFLLVESTFFEINIQQVFLSLIQYLLNGFYMLFSFVFSINEDIIKIYYYKNIKLLRQDLVNIVLKRD